MFQFTGTAGPQRRVDLRGRSRVEESREEVLEKARLQREKRQRAKLEQKSALAIQSRWRQVLTARNCKNILRDEWVQRFGLALKEGNREALERIVAKDTSCISMLLRFYDPCQEVDRRVLALLCTTLTRAAAEGTCNALSQAASAAYEQQQAATASSRLGVPSSNPSEQQLALFRISKLAVLCLSTLAACRTECSFVFSSQFSALPTLQQPTAAMVDFLIKVINPDSWRASLSSQQHTSAQQAAAAGAAAVLKHLYHKQLYRHLQAILQAIPARSPGKTCGEVLTTQLAVRSITLQLVPTRTPIKAAAKQPAVTAPSTSSMTADHDAAAAEALQYGVSQMLCVPNLWARCRSLAPVMGRVCTIALAELCQQSSSSHLLAAISAAAAHDQQQRTNQDDAANSGRTAVYAALAALMDNLLEASAAGSLLKGVEGEQMLAGQAVEALALIIEAERQLTAVQKQLAKQQQQRKRPQEQQQQRPKAGQAGAAFVPGAGFIGHQGLQPMAIDDSDEHKSSDEPHTMEIDGSTPTAVVAASSAAAAGPATTDTVQQPVATSVYTAEQAAQQQQGSTNSSCFHLLAGTSKGTQLLRKLVALVLPATTAAESAALQEHCSSQAQQAAAAGGALAVLEQQQQLCTLLWKLSSPMQYRQRIWLGLGVGVRLVPRLWFSYILPLHNSTRGGLLNPAPAAGSGAGWVEPLLVLVQAFSAALSFTHLEDFYSEASALLPLQQLYDNSNPSAGLVMLLKSAVWQILWNEGGGATAPPNPEQQQLRRSLGEVGGLLLCQLHDRNCTRQYCPPEAFLADIPAGRVLQEVTARGGAGGALGFSGDEEDEDGSNALEQQQEWQRQRQQGTGGLGVSPAAAGVSAAGGAGGLAEQQHVDDDDEADAGAVVEPGGAVHVTGRFGYRPGDVVQQRRQHAAQQGAAAAAGGGGGGGRSAANGSAAVAGSRVWLVLQHAPCLIPFQERAQLFQSVVSAEKEAAAAAAESHPFMFDDPHEFLMNAHGNKFVTIRRDQLLEDSYNQLKVMDNERLKGRLRIAYVNEAGLAEAGIDGGGLFKDFMEELLKQGFSPQAQLFAANPQHQLYPSPSSHQLVPDAEGQLQFLGRMLGKSLYEGILLELPLAAFFLKKMRGGVCDINDLPSLDPEVYKNLLQLRHFKGDFAELSLNFTATVVDPSPDSPTTSSTQAPRQHEVELKPGGRDIPVRADNVTEYIHRLADFRLNRQMDRAASAFLRGFFELIKPRWVRMFNEAELQMLISGSEDGIDVDDLVAHVNYAGGYHDEHPVIITLWEAIRSFTPQQQRQFLKFVTSCSRAPLLGFGYLEPQLCVQMSGSVLTSQSRERLPTAATCMNLLKLPPYVGLEEMRAKLLYAITAGAGFELS